MIYHKNCGYNIEYESYHSSDCDDEYDFKLRQLDKILKKLRVAGLEGRCNIISNINGNLIYRFSGFFQNPINFNPYLIEENGINEMVCLNRVVGRCFKIMEKMILENERKSIPF